MATPPDIRRRVVRLLGGDWRTDDLHRFFEYFRFKTAGRAPAVKDIGDFQAHRDARDEGVSWERGIQFCRMAALHLRDPTEPNSVNANIYKKAVLACFEAYGAASAKSITGMGFKSARKMINHTLDKIVDGPGGKLTITAPITAAEQNALNVYSQQLVVRSAISEAQLINELLMLLIGAGVLLPDEGAALRARSCLICAYAMTQMHGARLMDGKDEIATLHVNCFDKLSIQVSMLIGKVNMVADIFTTECPASDWCTQEMAAQWPIEGHIELSAGGRLVLV